MQEAKTGKAMAVPAVPRPTALCLETFYDMLFAHYLTSEIQRVICALIFIA